MSDTSNAEKSATEAQSNPPQINIIAQYVKDLSFENPKAPDSLRPRENSPNITINVNVNATPLTNDDVEVDLKLEAKALQDNEVMFAVELMYSGLFRLTNVPKEHLHPLVMIECPRLLFPFARQVVATCTRDGGFPPLMVDPVDFSALYRQRLEQIQAQQQAEGGQPN